jgi:hypothetical protein
VFSLCENTQTVFCCLLFLIWNITLFFPKIKGSENLPYLKTCFAFLSREWGLFCQFSLSFNCQESKYPFPTFTPISTYSWLLHIFPCYNGLNASIFLLNNQLENFLEVMAERILKSMVLLSIKELSSWISLYKSLQHYWLFYASHENVLMKI